MKKKVIVILFVVIIGMIAVLLGIRSARNNEKDGSHKDVSEDIKIEEVDDELIIVPQEQENSETNDKENSRINAKGNFEKDDKEDSIAENVSPSVNQDTEQDVQEGSINEELPFVPAE